MSNETTSETRPTRRSRKRDRTRVWPSYKRLLGYALRHRFRIATVLLFSFVIAVSFTTMIFSAGSALRVLYDEEDTVQARVADYREGVREAAARVAPIVGWDPDAIAEQFESFLFRMREDRSFALFAISVALIALSFVSGGARYLQEYYAGSIGANVTAQLSVEMYDNLVSLPHSFFEGKTTGELVARFTNDSFQVNRGLVDVFIKLFREPIKAFFLIGLALSVNAYVTLIVVFVISPAAFIVVNVGRRIRLSVRGSLTRLSGIASIISETLPGITVIKGFRMEDYQKRKMRTQTHRLRRHLKRTVRAQAAVSPATEIFMTFGMVAFIFFGNRLVSGGELSLGDFFLLFGSLVAMVDPLRKLASVNNLLQISVTSAERIFEIIDARPDLPEKQNAVVLEPFADAIRFEGVTFSYDGEVDALHEIDLELRKDEMVALVGFSGSGKSTMAKLVPRFYDPTRGRITFDGVDLRDASLGSLRDQISLVTQDTILFNETVRENIAHGREDLSADEIRVAAKKAHAAEFIDRLPQGYDTLLDESGANLSAGQRQRIAIARAIVKDPRILILDEATSNLDAESEQEIQKAIEEFVVGRATLVIAHRLATIRRADRIIVLDKGEIAEQGTREALLARGGIFERLYRLQFAQENNKETGSA